MVEKIVVALCLGLTLFTMDVKAGQFPVLILNTQNNKGVLPRKFRSTSASFLQEGYSSKSLESLHASGSAQFSKNELGELLKKIKRPHLIVIDLRQESHGFLNHMAVSWFCPKNWINKDKTIEQIEQEELQLLNHLSQQHEVMIYKRRPKEDHTIQDGIPTIVKSVMSEQELCNHVFNVGYFRITVADHTRPDDAAIDRFIQFITTLPPFTWLHFHCSAGEGRTSTFMSMYDMMRNAKELSLEEIFKRQFDLGGVCFLDEPSEDLWNYALKKERIVFLKQFYQYCRSNSDNYNQLWSEWIRILN
ncbi:MAG TPA: hypothetical protein VLG49_01215 [Rhabdochlamydiaceae bacterium]|nr:hypothetical protein [Rhabdochlamydiaceae bacterium]